MNRCYSRRFPRRDTCCCYVSTSFPVCRIFLHRNRRSPGPDMHCRCRKTSRAGSYSDRNRPVRSAHNTRERASSADRPDTSRRSRNDPRPAAAGQLGEVAHSHGSMRTIHRRTDTSCRHRRSRRRFRVDIETSAPQPADRRPATATRPAPPGERHAIAACQGYGRDRTAIVLTTRTRGNACALNDSNNSPLACKEREVRKIRRGRTLCGATHFIKPPGRPHPRRRWSYADIFPNRRPSR